MKLKSFTLNYGTTIFKALSDESRVRILSLLFHNKELCISDLEQVLDFTQSKTSRHLIYLKNSRIVNFRKINNWVLYYIVDEVSDLLNQIFSYLSKDQILQNDLDTYKVLYSNRELMKFKMDNQKWSANKVLK
jgi:ArsR family transcriptional regulator, arsenate/arsenite/antimonite-responsive transcriptional repressor